MIILDYKWAHCHAGLSLQLGTLNKICVICQPYDMCADRESMIKSTSEASEEKQ